MGFHGRYIQYSCVFPDLSRDPKVFSPDVSSTTTGDIFKGSRTYLLDDTRSTVPSAALSLPLLLGKSFLRWRQCVSSSSMSKKRSKNAQNFRWNHHWQLPWTFLVFSFRTLRRWSGFVFIRECVWLDPWFPIIEGKPLIEKIGVTILQKIVTLIFFLCFRFENSFFEWCYSTDSGATSDQLCTIEDEKLLFVLRFWDLEGIRDERAFMCGWW